MKIIHMIDDYRILCKEAEYAGKFEAYKAYTQKYPYFFHGVFQYLYCQPIENLKPMIEQVDFQKLLQVAEENYKLGLVDYAIKSIEKFVESMHADFDFTFLLGLELSNIGGCATPSDTGEPHLYIGIDKPLNKEWIEIFVPHEMFHMVRHHMTQDNAAETVFSRTIEEGLASYASLWAYNMEWNVINVAKTLGVSEKQADNLIKNTDVLLEKIILDGDKPISSETMNAYFVAQASDVEFPVIGYYVGLYLAHLSVKNGMDFEEFVSMSRNEIIDMWFKKKKDNWFTVEQIDEDTYVISEYQHREETHCYLLLGKKMALLIDTGLGVANIREIVDKITSLPIMVVTTHVHWDHIGGHRFFEEFAVHEEEIEWIMGRFPLPLSVVKQNLLNGNCEFPESFNIENYKIFSGNPQEILHDNDEIDLGNRKVKVLHTPGHSPGHCCFYEEERSYLYSGDLIYKGCLDMFYPTTNPELFAQSIYCVSKLEIKRILPGHHCLDVSVQIISDIKKAFSSIEKAGDLKQGKGILEFGNFQIHL